MSAVDLPLAEVALRVRLNLDVSPHYHPALLDKLMALQRPLAITCVFSLAESYCASIGSEEKIWFATSKGVRSQASTSQPARIRVDRLLHTKQYPNLVAQLIKSPYKQRAILLATLAEHALITRATSERIPSVLEERMQPPIPQVDRTEVVQKTVASDAQVPRGETPPPEGRKKRSIAGFATFAREQNSTAGSSGVA